MKQLEELKLIPGASVQLLVEGAGGQNYSLDSVYIGSLALHSLLVVMPSEHPEVVWRTGTKLAMTLVVPAGIATFNSQIEAIAEHPYSYIHIAYPQQVNFRLVRGEARVRVEFAAP